MVSESVDTKGVLAPRHLRVATLTNDPVVRLFVVLLAFSPLPLLLPILPDKVFTSYGQYLLGIPFHLGLLIVLGIRTRKQQDNAQRWFWILVFLGFAGWLLATFTGLFVGNFLEPSPLLYDASSKLSYLLFYIGLILALEVQPSTRQDSVPYKLRFLGWLGSLVLVFSLLTYFLAVPEIWLDGKEGLSHYSMALFVALDAYIIIRLWHLISLAVTPQWRTIYGWLFIAAMIWSGGDLLYYLVSEEVIAYPGWGAALELIWPFACTAVVIASRTSDVKQPEVIPVAAPYYPLGMGPLAIYVVSPLLLHVTLYHFGEPEAVLRPSRDALVLISTALLAILALIYHRFLRVENYRLAVEEVQSRNKMEHLAFHDELTGLPNRNLFRDRLKMTIADATRYGSKCAVLFCDLDNFKVINDSLGHEAGDQMLIAAGQRMSGTVRTQDTVARLGGDEFAIIAQGLHRSLDAALLAEKLLSSLATPLEVGKKSHVLNGSIGIAVFPDDGEDEESLLKHADTAMYQAKLYGRNTYRLFTQAMNEAAQERLAIEQGLRTGILEEQFCLFYQPIIDLKSGQTVSYEALLRWNHPERGFIPPVNFIDVAEQTGLIVELGQWVLETACAWATQLECPENTASGISVNISLRQLRDPGFFEGVQQALEKTGLDPTRLLLEITESMAMAIEYTAEVLASLREIGVRIAIDDFGTGYATLTSLQELPVDVVKIDKSFIMGMETGSVSEAIVLAIVSMSRALDYYVIAEGVETEAELKLITKANCDAAQGFLICHPLPPEELEQWPATPLAACN